MICTLPGTGEGVIVVGGHFDHTLRGAGIIDNWSGATMVANLLQALGTERRRHTFVFVAFAREEEGLLGSKAFVHGLTKSELAKMHIRHLVGGKSALAQDELLYRFEFPERPGALLRFVDSMAPNWNISLFHYRNQGADVGRILVGLQVPKKEMKAFRASLVSLGYRYWDENDNPAYKLFL